MQNDYQNDLAEKIQRIFLMFCNKYIISQENLNLKTKIVLLLWLKIS